MEWCKKRITNKELLVRFADGKHRFYLESVCAGPVKEGNLCSYCLTITAQTKTQDVTTFPHGLVNGKYTDESHIYDSPWYHKKVGTYGPPTKESLELAMEAQRKARAGIKIKTIKDILEQIADAEKPIVEPTVKESPTKTPEPEQKSRKGRKPNPKPEDTTATAPAPTKPRAPRAKKATSDISVQEQPAEKVLQKIPQETQFVENMNDIVVVDTVVKVYLKPITIGGVKYFRDPERDKLYSVTLQQKVGKYVGRWDSSEEKIVREAPDSDEDSCV